VDKRTSKNDQITIPCSVYPAAQTRRPTRPIWTNAARPDRHRSTGNGRGQTPRATWRHGRTKPAPHPREFDLCRADQHGTAAALQPTRRTAYDDVALVFLNAISRAASR